MRVLRNSLWVFFALVACAAASEGRALDPAWEAVGRQAGGLVVAAILYVVTGILRALKERHLIDEDLKMRWLLRAEEEASVIVCAVEAWALRQGREIRGEEKLREATRRLVERIPGLSGDRAAELVEAALVPLAQAVARRIGA